MYRVYPVRVGTVLPDPGLVRLARLELGEHCGQFAAFGLAHTAQFSLLYHQLIVLQPTSGWLRGEPAFAGWRPGQPLGRPGVSWEK